SSHGRRATASGLIRVGESTLTTSSRRHRSVRRYVVNESSSLFASFIAGIRTPGLIAPGASTHARNASGVLCAAPAAMVRRLIRWVRSGPNTPLAGVPPTAWQLVQEDDGERSRTDRA